MFFIIQFLIVNFPDRGLDPASPQNLLAAIEDRGLPRRHGGEMSFKMHCKAPSRRRFNDTRNRRRAIANLHFGVA